MQETIEGILIMCFTAIWGSVFLLLVFKITAKMKKRIKLRREQIALSKKLLHSLVTKQENGIINAAALALEKFNAKNLRDSKNYSNISKKESPEKRDILDNAYSALIKLLSK